MMPGDQTIRFELTAAQYANLRTLVVAGAKSPQTGEDAIMAAAQLLHMMGQAAFKETVGKPNGSVNHEPHSATA